MKFGLIATEDAEGGILAHGVKRAGLTFNKGRVVSAADIDALTTRNIRQISVALLDPNDVPEDRAAAEIAAAAGGLGLHRAAAFTGRANLVAETDGLLVVDRTRIDALNRVDEAVTIATLPEFAVVRPRQLVATIKIIPFAVPQDVLGRCLAAIDDLEPVLRVAPFRALTVALIQTELPGLRPSVLDKTEQITATRLDGLGSTLAQRLRCHHDVAALTDTLAGLLASKPDLILIAGASAIVDRLDVIPAAIEAAGGRVTHFGMPVDPGNLLLLGEIDGIPTLGLPGCARSPRQNGFDWVLQRLCAGLPLGSAEIMGLGVGGLLTDIVGRPQPRDGGDEMSGDAPRISAIVLAAGRSTRMGADNKLLLAWRGKPLVAHIVDQLLASSVTDIVVVTGHQEDQVRAALTGRNLRYVSNPRFGEGLSTSLIAGIAAIPQTSDGVLVTLGDMPRVDAMLIDRLIAAFNPAEGRSICLPVFGGKWGNPVLWARGYLGEMIRLAGDAGAKGLLQANLDAICEVAAPDDAVLADIDTPEAFETLIS